MEFEDLFELCTRETKYERLLQEQNNRHISSIGTYYITEIVSKKPCVCPSLQRKIDWNNAIETKEKTSSNPGRYYSFEIIKASDFFYHVVMVKFIKLIESHKISSTEELKKLSFANGMDLRLV